VVGPARPTERLEQLAAKVLLQHAIEIGRREEALLDEHFAERHAARRRLVQRRVTRRLGDLAEADEEAAERLGGDVRAALHRHARIEHDLLLELIAA